MSGDFLDSNVIVYSLSRDSRKRPIAESLVEAALLGGATISFQVVQEVLNVITREMPELLGDQTTRLLEDILTPLWHVAPSRQLYESALLLHERYGYSFYDSLIIAAALEADCNRLLSEDMQDGQRIEGLTIENPFRDLSNGRSG